MPDSRGGETCVDDLRSKLVGQLVEKGAIRSHVWRDVFRRVPREHFVPAAYRRVESDDGLHMCPPVRMAIGCGASTATTPW